VPRPRSEIDLQQIAERLAEGEPMAAIAREFELTQSMIQSFRQDLADHEAVAARKLHWIEKATRVQVAAAWLKLPRDVVE
jgi:DNA-binding NarL/FixJ family response regulator